jgi:hypothetical protein
MDFFTVAKSLGLCVEKLLEIEMDKVLFENDPGVSHFAITLRNVNCLSLIGRKASSDCLRL